jgi:hypothetical protein
MSNATVEIEVDTPDVPADAEPRHAGNDRVRRVRQAFVLSADRDTPR